MLDGGLDDLYRRALAGSHRAYVRVEVWREGVQLAEDVEFSEGNLTATLQSRVARTVNLTVPETSVPVLDDPDGLLTPFGQELRVFKGIELGDNTRFAWPVFRGKIAAISDSGDGTVQIEAADRGQEVVDAGFEVPTTSTVGARVSSEVRRLIADAVPDATVRVEGTYPYPVPELSWEYDRARGIDEMTEAVGALWYALPDGEFVMRPVPWATPPETVLDISDGPGGVVSLARGEITNRGVYNSVTAVGERADGSEPVYANVKEIDSYKGPLGARFKLLRLNTPTTESGARGAANSYLKRVGGLGEQWTWSQTIDAALELGDAVRLHTRRRRTPIVQVVAQFSMPLQESGQMTVTGRQLVLGVLDDLT